MNVIEISNKKKHPVEIVSLKKGELTGLKKNQFFFDWKLEKEFEVYKLQIVGKSEILGLISLERIPQEWRVHIRLLTVSKENKGRKKKYNKIAGNLIAYAAKIAVKEYGEFACVSLRSKGEITKHYISKYKMTLTTGSTLSIQVPEILDLINIYDNEER